MYTRYFVGFIATLGLIILLIVLLFNGGGNKAKVPSTSKTLNSYATTDAEVSMTIDGPIVADQDHQQIRVVVSNNDATFQHVQGYQGDVINQQSYANNVDAFTNFLFALGRVGFTNGNRSSTLKDERGYCPLGDRYIFELTQDGQTIERFWATSCGGTKTYSGNLDTTITLFQRQIPDYGIQSQNISL